jgi:two-component system, NarL family, sensor kinase
MLWVLGSNRLFLILKNIKNDSMRIIRLLLYWCLLTGSIGVQAQKKTKAQLLEDLNSTTDSIKLKASYQLAKNYLRVSLDTCEDFAEKAIVLAQKLNDKKRESECYALLGAAKKYRGEYEPAIAFHLKALAIKEKYSDDYGMSITLNDIGIVYKNLRRYDEAMGYYKRSLVYAKKANELKSVAMLINNIGTIHSERQQYDSAKYYLNQALPVAYQSKDSGAIVTVLSNLGEVSGNTKNYTEALIYFYKCLPIDKAFDDKYGIITDYVDIGGSLMNLRQFDKAKPYFDSAYTIADKENFLKEKIEVINSLVTYYTVKGELEKAQDLSGELNTLKDSTMNMEIHKNISELSTKYETTKKEKELQQQQFENTRKQYWIIGLLCLLGLGGSLAFSYYKRYRLTQEKRLQQAIIKQQDIATRAVIEAEENERKRIAGDLHDGVGQTMSAAKMNLSSIESRLNFGNEEDRIAFEKIVNLVDESCKEVRTVSHNMMPNALLKSGLSSAVKEFIDKIDSRILKVNLYSEGLNERLDSNVETVLYRVIQECVNNVIKHSGANALDISLIKDADGIAATIEDNGRGFTVGEKEKAEGIGLKNIRTRIEYLKGTVDFDSAPGKGTLVAIHVPL